jgi:general secretion pathway protein G
MRKPESTPRRHPHGRRAGFTLIEIMAVVLIIGLLSTLVGLAIFPQIDKARVNAAHGQMQMFDSALETYRMDNARFPTTDQGLVALIQPPPEARNAPPGGYMRERRVPDDPWGNPYQYESPGQHNSHAYDLWSFGADGSPGGEGVDADIGNWVDDADSLGS